MIPHFITIEGPIGIGKTSLATALAKKYDLYFLPEIVEENPFLGRFYQNIEEWSFQTEMFFLCNRYKQLRDIKQNYLDHRKSVVSDYNILKNTIFAKRTLTDSDLSKYLQIYEILTEDAPTASAIIYMNATTDTIMSRISRRGRDIEKTIERAYIERLRQDYQAFFEDFKRRYPDIPVLEIDGDQYNFVERDQDLQAVFTKFETLLLK